MSLPTHVTLYFEYSKHFFIHKIYNTGLYKPHEPQKRRLT